MIETLQLFGPLIACWDACKTGATTLNPRNRRIASASSNVIDVVGPADGL